MKPNQNIIFSILNYIERESNGSKWFEKNSLSEFIASQTSTPEETVFANLQYLIDEGLLYAEKSGIRDLTSAGRRHLDLIRNTDSPPLPHQATSPFSFNVGGSMTGNIAFGGNISDSRTISANKTVSSNFAITFDESVKLIENFDSLSAQDKILLRRLSAELELIIREQKPVSKGMLSRFADLLQQHSAAVATAFQPFINLLLLKS